MSPPFKALPPTLRKKLVVPAHLCSHSTLHKTLLQLLCTYHTKLQFICLCVCLFPPEYAPSRVKVGSCSSLYSQHSAQCWHNSHLKHVLVFLLLKKCMPMLKIQNSTGWYKRKGWKSPFHHPDHRFHFPQEITLKMCLKMYHHYMHPFYPTPS